MLIKTYETTDIDTERDTEYTDVYSLKWANTTTQKEKKQSKCISEIKTPYHLTLYHVFEKHINAAKNYTSSQYSIVLLSTENKNEDTMTLV